MSAPHSNDVPRNRLAATLADLDGLDLDAPTWAEVTGKPTTFPPSAHSHPVGDLTATGTASSTTYLRGDGSWATPTNTTYSVMSEAEATAGTATTARTISAARLKGAIQSWATEISQITGLQAALDGKEKVPWQGTQAQYDALGSYESDRTYYITD